MNGVGWQNYSISFSVAVEAGAQHDELRLDAIGELR